MSCKSEVHKQAANLALKKNLGHKRYANNVQQNTLIDKLF